MMSACLLNSSWDMPSTLLIFVLDTVSATASASQPSVSFLARLFGLLRATGQIQSALAYLCCPGRSSRSILLPAVGCALSVLLIDPDCGWQCIFRFFSATFGVDDRAHLTRDCLRVAADTFFGATARHVLCSFGLLPRLLSRGAPSQQSLSLLSSGSLHSLRLDAQAIHRRTTYFLWPEAVFVSKTHAVRSSHSRLPVTRLRHRLKSNWSCVRHQWQPPAIVLVIVLTSCCSHSASVVHPRRVLSLSKTLFVLQLVS